MRAIRLFLAVLLWATFAAAQGVPPPQRITVKSAVLNEDRSLLVRLPRGYYTSAERYPVLYMTDANDGMAHAISTLEFLVRNGRIPDLIVVGIENTDRTRDLTPTRVASGSEGTGFDVSTSGGADNFLRFVETEVMPQIETKYRTSPYKIFAGHSFGGLFAIHTLLTHPDAFNAYIAASPSLQWDKGSELKRAEQFLAAHKELKKSLFFTIANEGGVMQQSFDRFGALLKSSRTKGLDWSAMPMLDEDHGSSVLRAYYFGLRKVFADWQLPNTIRSVAEADAHYQRLSTKYGIALQTPEAVINRIGYTLIRDQKYPEAVAAFKINVERYPRSANVHDSLAEAYTFTKQYKEALESATTAVQIATERQDPFLSTFRERLDKLTAGMGEPAK